MLFPLYPHRLSFHCPSGGGYASYLQIELSVWRLSSVRARLRRFMSAIIDFATAIRPRCTHSLKLCTDITFHAVRMCRVAQESVLVEIEHGDPVERRFNWIQLKPRKMEGANGSRLERGTLVFQSPEQFKTVRHGPLGSWEGTQCQCWFHVVYLYM